MRRVLGSTLLVLLAGCGRLAGSDERACSEFGVPAGIGLTIPETVKGITRASMDVCWSGRCVSRNLELHPATRATETSCSGSACSARTVPIGELDGFADIPALPAAPVRVTVVFDDGKDHSTDVTPAMVPLGGPGCGSGGPQARLAVESDQSVRPI
jgi:hypothetical protein